jgi:hypothetical protein
VLKNRAASVVSRAPSSGEGASRHALLSASDDDASGFKSAMREQLKDLPRMLSVHTAGTCRRQLIHCFATHLEYLCECSRNCLEDAIQIKRTFYRTSVRCLARGDRDERDRCLSTAGQSLCGQAAVQSEERTPAPDHQPGSGDGGSEELKRSSSCRLAAHRSRHRRRHGHSRDDSDCGNRGDRPHRRTSHQPWWRCRPPRVAAGSTLSEV